MASDERDRRFNKAIARHLRSAAPSGDAADRAADSLPQRASCPDAETLAAYHERSLPPEELNSWKEHIVGCAHCQELLAHLELTDEIPLHAAEEEEVFAMTDAQHSAAARSIEALPRPSASGQGQRAERFYGKVRWRWFAPAGAIAASLLVWIALHENHRPGLPSSDEIKMAKNQEPPAPAPPLATRVPPAEPREQLTLPKSPSVTDEIVSSNRRAGAETLKQRQVAGYSAKVVPAKPSSDKESSARKDAERNSPVDLLRDEKQADLDAKAATDAVQQKIEVQAQAPAQDQNLQVQNQNNPPKAPGPAPLGQANAAKRMKAAPSPPPAAPAGVVSGYAGGAVSEMVMVSDSRLITAPGSNFVWRTGRAGLIEFSKDAGRSWSRQPSGVLVDLLTGSAPSGSVCWIVGRAGAVLLTTDGGAHWKLVSSPLKEYLGGIRATDALHATVWNVRSTKSFTTSDGGLTWNRLAKE
jgi:hypothetical protein